MKRFYLSVITLMLVLFANAQAVEKVEGFYYLVSPNAQYYAGAQEGSSAFRYSLATKEENRIDPESDFGFKTNAIANDGTVAGSYGFKAALWIEGNNYEFLPLPEEGLSELELATNDAVAISADAKQIVVAMNADAPKNYFVYTAKEDGSYDMVKLPMPEKDPLYGMYPQWISVRDMSLDGNTLIGFFLTDDGMRQLPMIWRRVDGVWSYEFFGLDVCLQEGKTIPPYPYDEMYIDEDGDEVLPYHVWEEWTTAQYEAESGYYYQTKGAMISGNGRYVALNMGIQLPGQDYGTIYAAAYDLEKDTLVVFDNISNATSLSVNDKGEFIVATPSADSFRWSFVVTMDNPQQQTLTEFLKNKTNGAIDLANYMTYSFDEYEQSTVVAEGTAYWAKEGEGLVTYIIDIFGTGMFESVFINLGVPSAERPVYDESQMHVYPNPTSGLLNVSKAMENVEIYDVIGRKVYTCAAVENSIDLSELHAGQYFLVATVEGQRISTKIMIKK